MDIKNFGTAEAPLFLPGIVVAALGITDAVKIGKALAKISPENIRHIPAEGVQLVRSLLTREGVIQLSNILAASVGGIFRRKAALEAQRRLGAFLNEFEKQVPVTVTAVATQVAVAAGEVAHDVSVIADKAETAVAEAVDALNKGVDDLEAELTNDVKLEQSAKLAQSVRLPQSAKLQQSVKLQQSALQQPALQQSTKLATSQAVAQSAKLLATSQKVADIRQSMAKSVRSRVVTMRLEPEVVQNILASAKSTTGNVALPEIVAEQAGQSPTEFHDVSLSVQNPLASSANPRVVVLAPVSAQTSLEEVVPQAETATEQQVETAAEPQVETATEPQVETAIEQVAESPKETVTLAEYNRLLLQRIQTLVNLIEYMTEVSQQTIKSLVEQNEQLQALLQ